MIDQKRIMDVLDYNPDSGMFFWRVRSSNRIKIGDIAGSVSKSGYRIILIDKEIIRAHRAAFIYMTGSFPKIIDHINGDRLDNRWCNIRESTVSKNAMNRGATKYNKLGIKNICQLKNGKYAVCVRSKGVRLFKRFWDLDDAKEYAILARNKIHGEFANNGVD